MRGARCRVSWMPKDRVALVQNCEIRGGDRRRGQTGARRFMRNDDAEESANRAGGAGRVGQGSAKALAEQVEGSKGRTGEREGFTRAMSGSQVRDRKYELDPSASGFQPSYFSLLTSYLLLLLLFLLRGALDRLH